MCTRGRCTRRTARLRPEAVQASRLTVHSARRDGLSSLASCWSAPEKMEEAQCVHAGVSHLHMVFQARICPRCTKRDRQHKIFVHLQRSSLMDARSFPTLLVFSVCRVDRSKDGQWGFAVGSPGRPRANPPRTPASRPGLSWMVGAGEPHSSGVPGPAALVPRDGDPLFQ